MNLRKEIRKTIKEQGERSWTGLAGLDEYEGLFEEPVTVSNFFEQEAVDDTPDICGISVETAIDDLMQRFSEFIKEQIPKQYQDTARRAVKLYWIQKLQDWKELRA